MERIRQVISAEGLHIPLPIIERYGLLPGAGVVLELEKDGIRILPVSLAQEHIENQALQYLLTHLGDTATVKVKAENDQWHVSVYGADCPDPLGYLVYSSGGQLLREQSTPVKEMYNKALQGL